MRLIGDACATTYRSTSAQRASSKGFLMATVKVDKSNFKADVLDSKEPVVVDFWAEWCGPCKLIGPSLEEISGELEGKLKIVKINIDENPMAPSKYGVRSIPTLLVFKNGQVAATKIGAEPKQRLMQWINSVV